METAEAHYIWRHTTTAEQGATVVQPNEDANFEKFVDQILPRLLRLGVRMTANREEAEDIAAEALARAYASWGKVGALQYRDAWVLRTATNLIVDLARRPTLLLSADADVAIPGFEDALTERSTLVGALKRLPRRQREAVVLRYLADYSVEEVSLAMRTSVNTVKKHLSRGLARLRDITSSSTSRK